MATLRFGALDLRHRARLAEILDATAAFGPAEIAAALALFDKTFGAGGSSDEGGDADSGPPFALHGEVEQRLRADGGRLLIVETSSRPDYEPMRRFYERRGYREVPRVAEFYGPADDRVIYAKRLGPRGADAPAARSLSTA
jgi:hypothetical protein